MMSSMASVFDNIRIVRKQIGTRLRARARLRRQQAMRTRGQRLKYAAPEQLAYADLLNLGSRIGLYFLAGTFFLYVFGFVAPKIPLSELPTYWSLSASRYSDLIGLGSGASEWFGEVGYGDYMNFLGIAFLCSLTIACHFRILPFLIRRRDFALSTVLILEIATLLLATSGILAVTR